MGRSVIMLVSALTLIVSGTSPTCSAAPSLAGAQPDAASSTEAAPAATSKTNSLQNPAAATQGDLPIAEAIRAALGTVTTITHDAKERKALRTFYEARNHAPVWVGSSGPSERFHAAVLRL